VTRPRAADDFATIRARMEELRRERSQASDDEAHDPGRSSPGGRSLLKASDAHQRGDGDRWPAGSTGGRRYASGR
jgi:hypothetical protein